MAERLQPLSQQNELYFHSGQLRVQLEVPKTSSLQENDIDRILRISSWDGDINDQIDAHEGGRSVLIAASEIIMHKGVARKGLALSGVCYTPFIRTEQFASQGTRSVLPSLANFAEMEEGKTVVGTVSVQKGIYQTERQGYVPLGSYTEEQWRQKIRNTEEIAREAEGFAVPTVEAYGRYLDLEQHHTNLGFIVFSTPDTTAKRVTTNLLGKPADYAFHIAEKLGESVDELQNAWKVHRQLHLSNLYHLEEHDKLYIMDWATPIYITGSVTDQAMKRAIDIIIPSQSFNRWVDAYLPSTETETKDILKQSFMMHELMGYTKADPADARTLSQLYATGHQHTLIDYIKAVHPPIG